MTSVWGCDSSEILTVACSVSLHLQVTDKRRPLKCITQELVHSGEALKEITEAKRQCLEVFLKNKPFADWLRQSLKGKSFSSGASHMS